MFIFNLFVLALKSPIRGKVNLVIIDVNYTLEVIQWYFQMKCNREIPQEAWNNSSSVSVPSWMFYQLSHKATHQEQAKNQSISGNHPYIPIWKKRSHNNFLPCDMWLHSSSVWVPNWYMEVQTGTQSNPDFFQASSTLRITLDIICNYGGLPQIEFLEISGKLIGHVVRILEQSNVMLYNSLELSIETFIIIHNA